ncbi:hypothetical protein [Clostridium perfringens]|nr:hypothetical protein [Clostridium perfringens]
MNNLTSSDISDKILSSQKTNSIKYKEKEETLVLPDISDLED